MLSCSERCQAHSQHLCCHCAFVLSAWGRMLAPGFDIRVCRYAAHNDRLDLSAETRLNADSEEMAQLQERRQSGAQAGAPPQPICELLFLTARAAHLGYVKMVLDQPSIQRVSAPLT